MTTRVLMVCLGNICRSPMAQGALEAIAAREGVPVVADSAGLGGWHAGDPPDARAIAAAARRGVRIERQRARQVTADDFTAFDLILAMEMRHVAALEAMRPAGATAAVGLLLDHAPDLRAHAIADPYFEGPEAFDRTFDLIETAVAGLVASLALRSDDI